MREKPPADPDFDDDKILWQRVTQNLVPMPNKQQKIPHQARARESAKTSAVTNIKPKQISQPATSPTEPVPLTPVDLRDGTRAGLDGRTQRRLSRGNVSIDRRLDLHGHTAAQAQLILQAFIENAAHSGCRCVLVITGKGAGVLRGHVPDWLKLKPLSGLVLALAEAQQADGGSGAFYVLLRRRRR